MVRAKKTDANQNEIVKLFRLLGCRVADTSNVGNGFVDIVVQRTHPKTGFIQTWLVEIKNENLPPSARKLTKAQIKFHDIWTCHIVESEDDVYRLLEIPCN